VPTYDYQCRQCGHTIEVIHSMTESGPEQCERCGGELRRVLFPAGIIFKGSGFYKTDSRSGGSTASTSASAKAEPATASETKPSSGDATGDASGGSSAPAKDTGKKENA
jgi:putative FmdB family regulatory protein